MQFEVATHRMAAEIGAAISLESLPIRWRGSSTPGRRLRQPAGVGGSADPHGRVMLVLFSTPLAARGLPARQPVDLGSLVAAEGSYLSTSISTSTRRRTAGGVARQFVDEHHVARRHLCRARFSPDVSLISSPSGLAPASATTKARKRFPHSTSSTPTTRPPRRCRRVPREQVLDLLREDVLPPETIMSSSRPS